MAECAGELLSYGVYVYNAMVTDCCIAVNRHDTFQFFLFS